MEAAGAASFGSCSARRRLHVQLEPASARESQVGEQLREEVADASRVASCGLSASLGCCWSSTGRRQPEQPDSEAAGATRDSFCWSSLRLRLLAHHILETLKLLESEAAGGAA